MLMGSKGWGNWSSFRSPRSGGNRAGIYTSGGGGAAPEMTKYGTYVSPPGGGGGYTPPRYTPYQAPPRGNYNTNMIRDSHSNQGLGRPNTQHERDMYYWQQGDPDVFRYSGGGVTTEERNDWLKRQGYKSEARPWEYDAGAFQNPFLGKHVGIADRMAGAVGSRGSNVEGSRGMVDMFANRASGLGGPSVAMNQLKAGTDRNIAQQMAMGRSGGNPAAMRSAMYATGDANQAAANQAAQLRSKEMQDAGSQYIAAQQAYQSGMQAEEAHRDSMIQSYINSGMSTEKAQWAANMELEQKRAEQHAKAQATKAKVGSAGGGPSPWWGIAGSGISAGGAIGAAAAR